MALFRKGDIAAAREQFAAVEASSPRFAPAPYMLGECCRKLGEFGEAVAAYERMLKLNPKDGQGGLGKSFVLSTRQSRS